MPVASVTMMFLGAQSWTDTGVDIAAGQRLVIDVVGMGCYAWNGSNRECYRDPNGESGYDSGFLVPGAPKFSVVGRIGGGNGFFVGSHYEGFAPATGRLYLAFNDCPNCYGDNYGGYSVNIQTPASGFNPGDEVMIIQMQGNGAGNHEFATVESISSDGSLVLTRNLANTYIARAWSGGATLCEHSGYGGRCETFQPRTDDGFLGDNYINDNQASSIRIDGDWRAMLYRNTGFRPNEGIELFTQSDSHLPDNAIGNDTVSSISVRANHSAQVIKVPHYNNVVVRGTLTVDHWRGNFAWPNNVWSNAQT
ncbi:MAG: hypothetical protein ACPLRM_09710, partial [Anaerolineae bacterium]